MPRWRCLCVNSWGIPIAAFSEKLPQCRCSGVQLLTMGLFPGITNYTANLEKIYNAPPHPYKANNISTHNSASRNPNRSTSIASNSIASNTNRTTSDGSNVRVSRTPSSTSTVSAGFITPQPRHQSSVKSSYPSVTRSGDSLRGGRNSANIDDDDDDDEVEIKISPTGSVLAPSPNPYDKTQKLRHANAQLMASRLPPKPPGKVRFNDSVIATEEQGGDHAARSRKPKTNVTLPPSLKKQ